MEIIKYDEVGYAIRQDACNGFDISYNPDDSRWYVCDRNTFGDLETRATFHGDRKGFHNARYYAQTHTANNSPAE